MIYKIESPEGSPHLELNDMDTKYESFMIRMDSTTCLLYKQDIPQIIEALEIIAKRGGKGKGGNGGGCGCRTNPSHLIKLKDALHNPNLDITC